MACQSDEDSDYKQGDHRFYGIEAANRWQFSAVGISCCREYLVVSNGVRGVGDFDRPKPYDNYGIEPRTTIASPM